MARVEDTRDATALDAFLGKYPSGAHSAGAKARLEELRSTAQLEVYFDDKFRDDDGARLKFESFTRKVDQWVMGPLNGRSLVWSGKARQGPLDVEWGENSTRLSVRPCLNVVTLRFKRPWSKFGPSNYPVEIRCD